jgi:hypothetical protein
MMNDPIVAEVREVRERHAAQFNYDLDAIYRDLKEREKTSGRSYVHYAPRHCPSRPIGTPDVEPNQAMNPTGMGPADRIGG